MLCDINKVEGSMIQPNFNFQYYIQTLMLNETSMCHRFNDQCQFVHHDYAVCKEWNVGSMSARPFIWMYWVVNGDEDG